MQAFGFPQSLVNGRVYLRPAVAEGDVTGGNASMDKDEGKQKCGSSFFMAAFFEGKLNEKKRESKNVTASMEKWTCLF